MQLTVYALALIVMLASPAVAVPVDSNAANQVAAIYPYGTGELYVLRTNGEVWYYTSGLGWHLSAPGDGVIGNFTPPVPVADIADWSPWLVYTRSGVLWHRLGHDPNNWETWPFPPPWGAVLPERQSLSGAKQGYR